MGNSIHPRTSPAGETIARGNPSPALILESCVAIHSRASSSVKGSGTGVQRGISGSWQAATIAGTSLAPQSRSSTMPSLSGGCGDSRGRACKPVRLRQLRPCRLLALIFACVGSGLLPQKGFTNPQSRGLHRARRRRSRSERARSYVAWTLGLTCTRSGRQRLGNLVVPGVRELGQQGLDPVGDVGHDDPDRLEAPPVGIRYSPVEVVLAGKDGARVAAAESDD